MFFVDRCFENKYIYSMPIFSYQIKMYLPECHSLKEKRGVLLSFRSKIQNKFHVSCAEMDFQDIWHSSLFEIVWVNSDIKVGQKMLEELKHFIREEFPFIFTEREEFEIL